MEQRVDDGAACVVDVEPDWLARSTVGDTLVVLALASGTGDGSLGAQDAVDLLRGLIRARDQASAYGPDRYLLQLTSTPAAGADVALLRLRSALTRRLPAGTWRSAHAPVVPGTSPAQTAASVGAAVRALSEIAPQADPGPWS